MEKRYQVFVSSTYSDLSIEREKVIHGLNKIGYIAVGMEQFPSTDESQMEYISRIIDESDYYILIMKAKYGSTDQSGLSYTELEFNYATSKNIPCLAFLYHDIESLSVRETDNDPEKMIRLNKFKEVLLNRKIVTFWEDVHSLVSNVKDSVNDLARRRPGVGYIRANLALDPQIANERERLLKENEQLKSRLSLSTLYDDASISEFISNRLNGKIELKFVYSIKDDAKEIIEIKFSKTFSYKALFSGLAIYIERTRYESKLFSYFSRYWISRHAKGRKIEGFEIQDETRVSMTIRYLYETMDLIKTKHISVERRDIMYNIGLESNRPTEIEWELTKFGKHILLSNLLSPKQRELDD